MKCPYCDLTLADGKKCTCDRAQIAELVLQNNLKTSRILELETALLEARADSDKRNAVVEAAKTILTQRHTTMREYVVDRNALGETLVALEGDNDA